jgi:hypothetical protein
MPLPEHIRGRHRVKEETLACISDKHTVLHYTERKDSRAAQIEQLRRDGLGPYFLETSAKMSDILIRKIIVGPFLRIAGKFSEIHLDKCDGGDSHETVATPLDQEIFKIQRS